MGATNGVPLKRQISTTNRRQSENSETVLVKEPTPVKKPSGVAPAVRYHKKRMELSERDIAFLASQTGKDDLIRENQLISIYFLF